jgi:hypothetical protein
MTYVNKADDPRKKVQGRSLAVDQLAPLAFEFARVLGGDYLQGLLDVGRFAPGVYAVLLGPSQRRSEVPFGESSKERIGKPGMTRGEPPCRTGLISSSL